MPDGAIYCNVEKTITVPAELGGSELPPRVLISTMNDVPGYEIEEVFGEVFGLTVRSRNAIAQFGAGLKALVGGELAGMTKVLVSSREEVTERLTADARRKGANAVIAFRFDTSEIGGTWTEICAYGTAVRIRKLANPAGGAEEAERVE